MLSIDAGVNLLLQAIDIVTVVSAGAVRVEGRVVAMYEGVVWCAGRTQVGRRRVVGRARVDSRFTTRGFPDTFRPDLDALGLGAVRPSRELLVDIGDEAVEVFTVRGRCC